MHGKCREGVSQSNRRLTTHVLVRSDQEAVVDVTLHQTGFTHALLSQHHYFGIHSHHGHSACVSKNLDKTTAENKRGGGWEGGSSGGGGALV